MSFAAVVDRVRLDFVEMPEMELTLPQAVRLWSLGMDPAARSSGRGAASSVGTTRTLRTFLSSCRGLTTNLSGMVDRNAEIHLFGVRHRIVNSLFGA